MIPPPLLNIESTAEAMLAKATPFRVVPKTHVWIRLECLPAYGEGSVCYMNWAIGRNFRLLAMCTWMVF